MAVAVAVATLRAGVSTAAAAQQRPHVLLIVADDLGMSDVSFGSRPGIMPTPELAQVCGQGLVLDNLYAQSTCTPSRASLLTGRYAANTGLAFAMLPGAVSGLAQDMVTLPQLLRGVGYEAHAVGKWHVGQAQWRQTPVGRGFQSHVGSLLWSMDYESKSIWQDPWGAPLVVDWIRAFENGTYEHYLERRHTTDALTDEAVARVRRHARDAGGAPLFLYLAYTAAHAPLVPLAEDLAACTHVPHLWRRQFCGLVRGLDRGVGRVVREARAALGEELLVVFTSDNGAAPWFGGLGAPFRGGKTTPFEQGLKVPSCVVDFSGAHWGRHAGERYAGLMHLSDVMPTLGAAAGVAPAALDALRLDGLDMGPAFRARGASPRHSMLLEMYYGSRGEFMFEDEDVVAFRRGRFKLIEASRMRESLWWHEPSWDRLNNSDRSWTTTLGEAAIRALERLSGGPAPFDTYRDMLVHVGIQHWYDNADVQGRTLLYDIEADPEERRNVAAQHPDVVEALRQEVAAIRDRRPPQQRFWMTIDRDTQWDSTLAPGECHGLLPPSQCRFAHPWIPDDVDLDSLPLVHGAAAWPFLRNLALFAAPYLAAATLLCSLSCRACRRLAQPAQPAGRARPARPKKE